MCESPLEADAVYWAESDPRVVELIGQPLRIETAFGTRPHYTFDLEIRYVNGESVLCEVKPTNKLVEGEDGEAAPGNWDDINLWCDSNGYSCRVVTEETLEPCTQAIANWRYLLPFAKRASERPDSDLCAQLIADITREPGQSIRSLLTGYGARVEEQLDQLCYLLHQGRIVADLTRKPVTLESVLAPVS